MTEEQTPKTHGQDRQEKKQDEGTTVWDAKMYLGKELKKQGKNDNGEWKLFTLKFEAGGQYPFTLSCFSTVGTKEDSKSPRS